MPEIELSAGTLDYHASGGAGPVIVLVHGLMMDASLWDGAIAELSADHRCVAPTLPTWCAPTPHARRRRVSCAKQAD